MLKYWNFEKWGNGTTVFFMEPADINKYIHQNKAEYTGCFVEGCLQDSFVLSCKRGYTFVYEHFLTPWSSDLFCIFLPYKAAKENPKTYDEEWCTWFNFEDRASKEA